VTFARTVTAVNFILDKGLEGEARKEKKEERTRIRKINFH